LEKAAQRPTTGMSWW